jgi:hypothetical protein
METKEQELKELKLRLNSLTTRNINLFNEGYNKALEEIEEIIDKMEILDLLELNFKKLIKQEINKLKEDLKK